MPDYEDQTVEQLQDELRSQGKAVSGTKPELIARLEGDGGDQAATDRANRAAGDRRAAQSKLDAAAGPAGSPRNRSDDKKAIDRTYGRTIHDADTYKEAGSSPPGALRPDPEGKASQAAEAAAVEVATNAEYAAGTDGT